MVTPTGTPTGTPRTPSPSSTPRFPIGRNGTGTTASTTHSLRSTASTIHSSSSTTIPSPPQGNNSSSPFQTALGLGANEDDEARLARRLAGNANNRDVSDEDGIPSNLGLPNLPPTAASSQGSSTDVARLPSVNPNRPDGSNRASRFQLQPRARPNQDANNNPPFSPW